VVLLVRQVRDGSAECEPANPDVAEPRVWQSAVQRELVGLALPIPDPRNVVLVQLTIQAEGQRRAVEHRDRTDAAAVDEVRPVQARVSACPERWAKFALPPKALHPDQTSEAVVDADRKSLVQAGRSEHREPESREGAEFRGPLFRAAGPESPASHVPEAVVRQQGRASSGLPAHSMPVLAGHWPMGLRLARPAPDVQAVSGRPEVCVE